MDYRLALDIAEDAFSVLKQRIPQISKSSIEYQASRRIILDKMLDYD